LDSRWFKEDREQARKDKTVPETELREASKKALQNSTLFQRRLEGIIDSLIQETERADEDFTQPNWERVYVSNVSRRKVLREIKQLIQLK
jgi:hypothetical protein